MLRSIKKAHDMILKEDPETAITTHTIRMWCKEGKIKYDSVTSVYFISRFLKIRGRVTNN